MAKHRDERTQWFYECCKAGTYTALAAAHPDGDPVAKLLAAATILEQQAKNLKKADASFFRDLRESIEKLYAQLNAMETNEEIRAAVGYRLLVSDHLPTLIEFEL